MSRRTANGTGRGSRTASEIATLRTRVKDAEETLRALRQGEVDAIVGTGPSGEQIFTLKGAEQPYRVMVETMNEGAVTLSSDGTILYANRHFAELVASKLDQVIGSNMQEYLAPGEAAKFIGLMRQAGIDSTKDNVDLIRSDGSQFPSLMAMRRLGTDGAFEIITVITDLSELIRAEERQERLARIVETARCTIFATDLKGVITAWNGGAADMLGYAAEEIVGKSAELLVAAAQRADVAGLTAKAAAGETTPAFEARYVAKDGHLVDVSLTKSPIRSRTGAVTGVSTIAFDVTARWRAESSLKQEKAFSDAVIESLPGTFFVLDDEGRHVRWNEAERVLAGLPADRMHQATILDLVHPDDRSEVDGKIKQILDVGQASAEARIAGSGGVVCQFLLTGKRLDIGSRRYVVGHGLDISQRKTAQKQLETVSLYTRSLIEAGLDPMFVIGADGRIIDVNEATIRATGISRDRMMGTDLSTYFSEPAKVQASYREAFSRGFVSDHPFSLRRPSEGTAEVLFNASIYRKETGATDGLVVTVRDITEQKRRQDEAMKVQEQLVATVAELRRREHSMAIIDGLNETLQTCNSRDEAFPLIAMSGERLFEQSTGGLAVFGDNNQELTTVARWGTPSMAAGFRLDDCWGLRRGHVHELEAIGRGPLCRHFDQPPTGPYLCLPLSVHGEAIGLLHLGFAHGDHIGDNLRRLAGSLGEAIKLSLSNLKLRETLRDQAIHDPLTGLHNRLYLRDVLAREMHRARRFDSSLCVMMLDIDHFKRVNDVYGHEAGDAVLRQLGALLRDSVRESDVTCRYGGEEFLLVLPDTSREGAETLFNKIRQRLALLKMTLRGRELTAITVSGGIAQAAGPDMSADDLIAAADRAMHAAKEAGRDCVRHADPLNARVTASH